MRLFWNFIKAFLRSKWGALRGYETLAPQGVAAYRFKVCQDCPWFDGEQCELCGCLAMAKTMLATEECPRGLWSRVWLKKRRTPGGIRRTIS